MWLQGFYSDQQRKVMLYDEESATGDLLATGVTVVTRPLSEFPVPLSQIDSAARKQAIRDVRTPIITLCPQLFLLPVADVECRTTLKSPDSGDCFLFVLLMYIQVCLTS